MERKCQRFVSTARRVAAAKVKFQGLPAPDEEIVPSKEPVVKPVAVDQALDGEAPSDAGEPTCTPRDGPGINNGKNSRGGR